jgi:hypothetical protein
MSRAGQAVLKLFAITVAVLFALGVVLAVGDLFFFGSSKVRPLFGMSVDALAGRTTRSARGGCCLPSRTSQSTSRTGAWQQSTHPREAP